MKTSPEQLDLTLDRRIDAWYLSRHGTGSPAEAGKASAKLTPDVDLSGLGGLDGASQQELDGLLEILDLVAELASVDLPGHHVTAAGSVGIPVVDITLPLSGARRGIGRSIPRTMLTAVAAVALLIAGVGIGMAVAGRGTSGPRLRPGAHAPALPGNLLSELRSEAGFAADPYPAQPITWVETTMARLRAHAPENFAYARDTRTVAAAAPVWIAYVRGNFYGDVPQKSDIFHLSWYLDVPNGIDGLTGNVPSQLLDLGALGTVHYLYLRPPPPQAVLPSRIESQLEHWVGINGGVGPSEPALWAQTTVGRIRSLVSGTKLRVPKAISSLSSGTTAWAVDIRRPVSFGSTSSADQWWFETSRSDFTWWVEPLSGIQRYGHVNELWLTSGAPTNLSPLVDRQVSQAVMDRYEGAGEHLPASVSAEWIGTTVAAIEQVTRPQVDDYVDSVPALTPVWVVELRVRPTPGHAGRSDWVTVTTRDPASTQVLSDYSQGGSPFFGITKLSQLGTAHQVTFHVTPAGTVTSGS